MKKPVLFALLCIAVNMLQAMSPYSRFLLMQLKSLPVEAAVGNAATIRLPAPLPRYQIPKGSVFCIMEDKLTRATGIWMKVGVK